MGFLIKSYNGLIITDAIDKDGKNIKNRNVIIELKSLISYK